MFFNNKLICLGIILSMLLSGCLHLPELLVSPLPYSIQYSKINFKNESSHPLLVIYGPYSGRSGAYTFLYVYFSPKENSLEKNNTSEDFTHEFNYINSIQNIYVLSEDILQERTTYSSPIGVTYITQQNLGLLLETYPPLETYSRNDLHYPLSKINKYEEKRKFVCVFNSALEFICYSDN